MIFINNSFNLIKRNMPSDSNKIERNIGKYSERLSQEQIKAQQIASTQSQQYESSAVDTINSALLLVQVVAQNIDKKKQLFQTTRKNPAEKTASIAGKPQNTKIEIISQRLADPSRSQVSTILNEPQKADAEIETMAKSLTNKASDQQALNKIDSAGIEQKHAVAKAETKEPLMNIVKIASIVAEKEIAPLNIVIANEAYKAVEESLTEITNKNFVGKNIEEKQKVGRNILCKSSMGFEHNFLHLISIPLVQIQEEVEKYQSMLKATKKFLLTSELSFKEAFEQTDTNGNSPLHTMASLSSKNQFKAFLETFGDLIPLELWHQKNKYGHSPLDILQSEEIQKKSMTYVSKKMGVEMAVASTSPSDVMYREITSDRGFCSANVIIPAGRTEAISAYPAGIFRCLEDGSHVAIDPINQKTLETLTKAEYESIKPYLLDSLSYSQKTLGDRIEKLQDLQQLTKACPSPQTKTSNNRNTIINAVPTR